MCLAVARCFVASLLQRKYGPLQLSAGRFVGGAPVGPCLRAKERRQYTGGCFSGKNFFKKEKRVWSALFSYQVFFQFEITIFFSYQVFFQSPYQFSGKFKKGVSLS